MIASASEGRWAGRDGGKMPRRAAAGSNALSRQPTHDVNIWTALSLLLAWADPMDRLHQPGARP